MELIIKLIKQDGKIMTKDDEKKVEESPKDLTKKGKNLLSQLLDLIVIIVFFLILGFLVLVAIVTVGEIFSPTRNSEIPEKVERKLSYREKKKSWTNWEEGYQIEHLKHFPGQELSFKVCGGLGCTTDFQSDAGSSKTGQYYDGITGETGRFEIEEWKEAGVITGYLTCMTNCNQGGEELFELY